MPRNACPAVVSIQRDGSGDALERHLGWAVLVDTDAVLVSGPLDWLRDPDVTFEVLLASGGSDGPRTVERIRPRIAEIVATEAAPEGAAAVIWLDRPTEHRPSVHDLDPDALRTAIDSDPDVFRALEVAGVIDPGVVNRSADAVLGPVAVWERRRREDLVRREHVTQPAGMAGILCCWLISCEHCMPCRPAWWE